MGKPFAPPPLNLQPPSFNLDNKISPSILYIIIILAIIFFVSALLHLILRCFLKRTQNDPDEPADVTALQGQLRQLFHLHDAGVDQLYIDTLPVFPYKSIIGVKDPFDCAVCLCEFEPADKLRLLPKCSHAFHMDCIDTWLLSHSTCPLCRSSLLPDFNELGGNGYRNSFPFVCVLESGSVENSREIRESVSESDSQLGSNRVELGRKSSESWRKEEGENRAEEGKIVTIKLGKFKNLDEGVGSSEDNMNDSNVSNSNNDLGSRRCYSMGSFAYVLDEKTSLQVPVKTLMKKQRKKKPGHRAAMSEYEFDSRRDFNGIEAFRTIEIHCHGSGSGNGNGNERSKKESFSVSKIWQRGVRAGQRNRKGNGCSSRRTISEIEIEIDEAESEGNEEIQSCYSVDSVANPSGSISNRRTLLWLMGKQSKVVDNQSSSVSSNV